MSLFFQHPLSAIISMLTLSFFFCLSNKYHPRRVRLVCLWISVVVLLLGVIACLAFDKSQIGFQFLLQFPVMLGSNLTFSVGVDGLALVFLLLTLYVFPVCIASAWAVSKQIWEFFIYLLIMEILIVITFTTLDLFYFYIFFESLLIPMFILIGVWGARERKIKAGYLFFLYTLFGSLIMLFGLLYLFLITGSTNYFVLLHVALEEQQQYLVWGCFFMAFAVKMPLYPFHIWLPEAHVEAPTVGSMLLASLLLKLGGYGFLRFSLSMLSAGSAHFNSFVLFFSLLGVVYGSISTIRQIDLKRVIAYSSVAHMNLVMLGLFSYNQQGIEGAIYLMIGHGIVSTALFFCVGVMYDRYHSRLLRYYSGMVTVMPLFAFFFFAFTLANMSFPGTSNFLGELLMFLGIYAKNSGVLILSTAGIVLSAVYSVWLYNRIAFGTLRTEYITRFTDLTIREFSILSSLLAAMITLGVTASFTLDFLSVATLLPTEGSELSAGSLLTLSASVKARLRAERNADEEILTQMLRHRPFTLAQHLVFEAAVIAVRNREYIRWGRFYMPFDYEIDLPEFFSFIGPEMYRQWADPTNEHLPWKPRGTALSTRKFLRRFGPYSAFQRKYFVSFTRR